MKLYEVKVTFSMMVVADDEFDAEEVARLNIGTHVHDEDLPETDATEIESVGSIPESWLEALPYGYQGGDEELNCARVLEKIREQKRDAEIQADAEKRQVKIPEVE